MRCSLRHVSCATLLALACTACGERARPHTDAAGDPSARSSESPLATTPRAPGTKPEADAAQLISHGLTIAERGFAVRTPLTCRAADAGDSWSQLCRVLLSDAERRGENAVIDIRIYDHDVKFSEEDAGVQAHVEGLPHEFTLNTSPRLQFTSNKGVIRLPESACHQSFGHRNSPAYCTLMLNSRVMIMAGVRPLRFSTMVPKVGDGPDASNRDVARASDLLGVASLKLGYLLFSGR
jgi:hypothetical protein